MTLNVWTGLIDPKQTENVREGAPYNDPAFEALARDLGVWGTPQSAICAQFWQAAQAQRAPLLFNPFNGKPRHPLDVKSDPNGLLIATPGAELRATRINQEKQG